MSVASVQTIRPAVCLKRYLEWELRGPAKRRAKIEQLKLKPTGLLLAVDPLELAEFCRLIQCIRTNDRRMIESLVRKGIPHITDYVHPTEGETALGLAASKNDDAMIRFLLGLGANPSVVDLQGRSAAMRAAEMGFVQSMEVLVKANCDMKIIDEDGKGILFYCFTPTRRHLKCAELAIEHGADVNNVSVQGTPALVAACETAKGMEDLCMTLLNAGADPKIIDTETHRTALMSAAASGSPQIVRAVLDHGANVNEIMTKGKFHALHEAAKSGCLECMKIMAAYGADFNQQTDRGFSEMLTPIHITAAARNDGPICTFLAQRGTNAKLKNREGETARQMAKVNGFKVAAKACRKGEKFAKKNAKRPPLWTLALHDFLYYKEEELLAAFQKIDVDGRCVVPRLEFEEIMTNSGAPLPGETDWPALVEKHLVGRDAVDYVLFLSGKKFVPKKFQMVTFEPKKKKDKKKKKGKKAGKAPIPICILPSMGRPRTFVPRHVPFTDYGRFDRDRPPRHPLEDDSAWYMQRPPWTEMEMNAAVRQEDVETLVRAVELNPVQPIVPDRFYKSPLAVAAAMGNFDMVKLLVENGAKVNQKDNFLWTPLHLACHSGMKNVVEYLLDRGAKLDVPSLDKATPMMKAIESCSPDVVRLLIERGAQVRAEDRAELTPLEIAACFGDYVTFSTVKAKEDSMAPVKEKRNKPRPSKKKAPPPIASTVPGEAHSKKSGAGEADGVCAEAESSSPDQPLPPLRHRPSLLMPATSLARGYPKEDGVTFRPRQEWTQLPTTEELIARRERRRDQYGWMVDFDDFLMPFSRNVADKLEALEAEEAKYAKKRPIQMIKRPKAPKEPKQKKGKKR